MNEERYIELVESVIDFCNGLEALAVNLRRQVQGFAKGGGPPRWNWNPDKIQWYAAEGFKGKYERSEDLNNLQFKVMLKNLAEHEGTLTREGLFYWVFKNGAVVGRKKRTVSNQVVV